MSGAGRPAGVVTSEQRWPNCRPIALNRSIVFTAASLLSTACTTHFPFLSIAVNVPTKMSLTPKTQPRMDRGLAIGICGSSARGPRLVDSGYSMWPHRTASNSQTQVAVLALGSSGIHLLLDQVRKRTSFRRLTAEETGMAGHLNEKNVYQCSEDTRDAADRPINRIQPVHSIELFP